MIAIIDYDTGNLRSVTNAIARLGAEYTVTADPAVITGASRIILPGVGQAGAAMSKLSEKGLDFVLKTVTAPVLGIYIGMQLMCNYSQEGETPCMGIFDTRVRRLDSDKLKVPHVGWNTMDEISSTLFGGIGEGSYFYYVHSFAADLCPQTIGHTAYGTVFSAVLKKDNFYGCQFHPEKSGKTGALFLRNFLEL